MAHSLRRRTEPVDYNARHNTAATPGWLKGSKTKARTDDGAASPELKSMAASADAKAAAPQRTNAAAPKKAVTAATQDKENQEAPGKRSNQGRPSKQALLAPRSSNAADAAKAEDPTASPAKRSRARPAKAAAEAAAVPAAAPGGQAEAPVGKASRKSLPASKAAADAAVLQRAAALKRKSAPPAVEAAPSKGANAAKANSKKGKAAAEKHEEERVDGEGDVIMTQATKPAPKPAANKAGGSANRKQARSAAAKAAASAPQEPARSGGSAKSKGAAAAKAAPAAGEEAKAAAAAAAPANRQSNSGGGKAGTSKAAAAAAAAEAAAEEGSKNSQDAAKSDSKAAGAAASKKRKSTAAAAEPEAAAAGAAEADAAAGGSNGSKGGANKRRRANNTPAVAVAEGKQVANAAPSAPAAANGRQSKAQAAAKAPRASNAAAAAAGAVGAAQAGKGKGAQPQGDAQQDQQQQEDGQEDGLPPTPRALGLSSAGSADFAALQANYRQLAASYETLKARKIKTLQAMIDEENEYVREQGVRANDLANVWRKEAETQRQFAAAARAPDTNAQMKALQDKNLDMQSRLVAIEALMTEKDAALAEALRQLEAAGYKPAAMDASMQACPEMGEMSAQQTPGLMGPPASSSHRRAVSMQFPTPKPPSPGIGLQFPTPNAPAGPYNTPGGINASLWGGPLSAAKPPAHGAGGAAHAASGAAAAGAAAAAAGVLNTPGSINASLWGGVAASGGRASVPHTMRGMAAARAAQAALGQGSGGAVAALQAGVQTSDSGSPVQGLLKEAGAAQAAASAGYDGQFAFPSDDAANANQAPTPSHAAHGAHSGGSATSAHPSVLNSAQRAVQLQALAQDMRQQQQQQQQGLLGGHISGAQRTPASAGVTRMRPGQVLGRGVGGTPVVFAMPAGSGYTPGARSVNMPGGMRAPANTPMAFVATTLPYAATPPVPPGSAGANPPNSAARSGMSPTALRLRSSRLSFDRAGMPMIGAAGTPQAAGAAGAAGLAATPEAAGMVEAAGGAGGAGAAPTGAAAGVAQMAGMAAAAGLQLGGSPQAALQAAAEAGSALVAAGVAATPEVALLRAAAAVPLPGDTPISGMRTPGVAGAGQAGATRMTPRLSAARPPASITRHLMPLEYLLDFEAALVGPRSYQYTHATTGFAFRMGPAASMGATSALHGVEDDSADGDEEYEGGVYEEVAFVPVTLGSAAGVVPEYLKEPITFAASRKPQLVRILVEALADAAKVARAKRRSAHNAGPGAAGTVVMEEDAAAAGGAGGAGPMEGIEGGAGQVAGA